jgi:hypothetical protein
VPGFNFSLPDSERCVTVNLDRAGRLGLLKSADEWITIPNLRNQMVHEYVEDPVVLIITNDLLSEFCWVSQMASSLSARCKPDISFYPHLFPQPTK